MSTRSERARTAIVAVFGAVVLAACGGPEATAAERATCREASAMVRTVTTRDAGDLRSALSRLEALAETVPDDTEIGAAARALNTAMNSQVDVSPMTLDEVNRLANEALERSAGALEQLAGACDDIGQPVPGITGAAQ